eukprot:15365942-Ditylum_brightwellii.AAC.1
MEFKHEENMCASKRPDGKDKPAKDICPNNFKQDSKIIVFDNNFGKRKKLSSHWKKKVNSDKNAKGNKPKCSYNIKKSSKYSILCKQLGGTIDCCKTDTKKQSGVAISGTAKYVHTVLSHLDMK